MDVSSMETKVAALAQGMGIGWRAWVSTALMTLAMAWLYADLVPGDGPTKWTPYVVAKFLLIAPALEEAAFRGGLQTLLLARFPRRIGLFGVSLANVLASVAFAGTHIYFGSWQSASLFLPSLVLGWVYERSEQLWTVILLHMAFNAAFLAVCFLN
jgi:membrane protease YdiL (CAAX protease family)